MMFKNIDMSFEQSKKVKSWFENDAFSDAGNMQLHEVIHDSLLKKRPRDRINPIASIFQCDPDDVCLVSRKKAIVNGKKDIPVICVMSNYNDNFNNVIRSTGVAKFDGDRKYWKIEESEDARSALIDYMSKHFKVVIDCESMTVLLNKDDKVSHSPNQKSFVTLPYHKKFTFKEFMDAISIVRKDDIEDIVSVYLYDGSEFKNYNEFNNTFWTQSPFLLFRYNMKSGQPRYAVYSTIGKFVEKVVFQSSSKKLSKMIAQFRDKGKEDKNIYIKPKSKKTIVENKKTIEKLREEFSGYKSDEVFVNSVLSDCYGFPLSSAYIDSNTYTGDREHLLAYASEDFNDIKLSKNIAMYFGYQDKHKHFLPVVFNSNKIDQLDFLLFQDIMVHEMAHHIVFLCNDEYFKDFDPSTCHDGHSLSWIFTNNILMSFVCGEFIETNESYYRYEFLNGDTIGDCYEGIDDIVGDIVDEALDEYDGDVRCTLDFLAKAVQEGLKRMNDYIEEYL